ncbi:hypothetical protein T08_9886 [Trichinella sp. T8]|nr:hypothetical protein T08_9886 [Trichinella sp. T8]
MQLAGSVFSVSFCKRTCHLKNQTEKARHQLPSGWHTAESRCFQTGSMKRCLGPQGMLTNGTIANYFKRVVVTLNHVNSLNSIEITMRNLSSLFSFYDSSQSYEFQFTASVFNKMGIYFDRILFSFFD